MSLRCGWTDLAASSGLERCCLARVMKAGITDWHG
jgi:hypothetical protein